MKNNSKTVSKLTRRVNHFKNRIETLEAENQAIKAKSIEVGRLYAGEVELRLRMEPRIIELKNEIRDLKKQLEKSNEICKELGI